MIAIIIAIVLYQIKKIGDVFDKGWDIIHEEEIPSSKTEREELFKEQKEALSTLHESIKQDTNKIRLNLAPAILSIMILLIASLFFLLFTKTTLKIPYPGDVNIALAIVMTFLIIYSIYCLTLLLREIIRLLTRLRI